MEIEGGRRWTPTRAVAQDTRATSNSLETHLVMKCGALDINGLWDQEYTEQIE